jgi:hypothetical protein
LVHGDYEQALLCKLAIRGNEGGSRRVKARTEGEDDRSQC